MVTLIALVSSGKGTWSQVSSLINSAKWDKIYLICNEFAYNSFDINPNLALKLKFDENDIESMFQKLTKFFKGNIKDFEVCINLTSGTGQEHMAVLSAVLKSGLGIRFVYSKDKELKEYEILEEKFISEDEF